MMRTAGARPIVADRPLIATTVSSETSKTAALAATDGSIDSAADADRRLHDSHRSNVDVGLVRAMDADLVTDSLVFRNGPAAARDVEGTTRRRRDQPRSQ